MSLSEEATGRVTVLRVPDGEAPLWVREAWVGIILACFPYVGTPTGGLRGILSDDEIADGRRGVIVPQAGAIEEVSRYNRKAADWWRDNGFGNTDEYFFFFEDEVGIVSGVSELPTRIFDEMETGHWKVIFSCPLH